MHNQPTPEVAEMYRQIFGEDLRPDDLCREIRLKVAPTGHLTLAHPRATGERIILVTGVPARIPTAEVVQRMNCVAVLRPGTHGGGYGYDDPKGARVVDYTEIREGAIIR